MTGPEEAIETARERAAQRQARAGDIGDEPAGLEASITAERPSLELLSEWSVIEVDSSDIYSTRRAGAPITALKHLLLRLLGQYHRQLEARQTRFNIALLSHFRDLEERVARLESQAQRPETPSRPAPGD
ncbi:MAG: hypothetical protein ACR2F4_02700 [Thermoleophilaceae bacterium]|nr:hypothetical protein [Thermoleophilaceae bacterium]